MKYAVVYKYSKLSHNRQFNIRINSYILSQIAVKYRSIVLQMATIWAAGAVCSTVDLRLSTISLESLTLTRNSSPV